MADQVITAQKLIDADKDATSLDAFINGADSATVTTRKLRTYPSLAKAVKQVMETGGFEPFATEALLKASVPILAKKAAKALDTKKVWLWDGVQWNDTGLSELDLAKEYVDDLDSLIINTGKPYPFKALTRGAVVSNINKGFADAILSAKVVNAVPGKVYKIELYMNGTTASGFNPDGWMIYQYDADTFSTSTVDSGLLVIRSLIPQEEIDHTQIKKYIFKSTAVDGLAFELIIDGAQLPAYGSTRIRSRVEEDDGYSWIIDPTCYEYKDPNILTKTDAPKAWLYNKGVNYPFVAANYAGITSIASAVFSELIIDAYVENAEYGFVYTIAYYTNGSTALGAGRAERWIIYKRLFDTYETSVSDVQIVDVNTAQPTLRRTGEVESITLNSKGFEKFTLILDTSKLPTYGTYITAVSTSFGGYSWYISPSNYKHQTAAALQDTSAKYFSYSAVSNSFKYRYISGGNVYQFEFGENGANSLPNFKSTGRAVSTDVKNDSIAVINSFSTDWLPPLIFSVDNGDAGVSPNKFTGGNHASSGSAEGDPTAINEVFEIYVDGQLLDKSKDLEVYCQSIDIKVVNKLMASNTTTSKRYCLRQIFELKFNGSNVDVHCTLKPLEAVQFKSDYAVQMTTIGFNDTVMFLNGVSATRSAYSSDSNSGSREDAPNAWAAVLKSSNGILASWIDRNYGMGISTNAAADQPLISAGGGENTKLYHRAYRSYNSATQTPLTLTPTSDYKWRGGYVIQADNSDTVYDSILKLKDLTSIVDANTYY